jgi:ketopantoate reductase
MGSVVVWGVGQLGGVFARGLLRLGKTVHPILRHSDLAQCAEQWPDPELALIAVGEKQLPEVLRQIPNTWRKRVALLQNELLPGQWRDTLPTAPTVCAVWFEKRPTSEVRVVLPSVCHGPGATLLAAALQGLSIPARVVEGTSEMHFELALKNLYILTINCAGLAAEGNVATLWQSQPVTRQIALEICSLQSALLGEPLSEARLMEGLEQAILADPEHGAKGRFAAERLQRCLAHADRLGLALPTLRALANSVRL